MFVCNVGVCICACMCMYVEVCVCVCVCVCVVGVYIHVGWSLQLEFATGIIAPLSCIVAHPKRQRWAVKT